MSRDKQGLTNRDVNAANRAALAVKLRAGQMTYEAIAAQCGFANASVARKAILRELDRCVVKEVDELRTQELSMLNQLHAECWQMAMNRENKGRLFAVDRILAIAERKAKLMGLDVARDTNIAAAQVIVRELPPGYLAPLPPQEATS